MTNPVSAITDASYWYLGYALPNEEAGLAFVEVYREAVEETGKPPTGKIKLESRIEVIDDDYTPKLMSAHFPLAKISHDGIMYFRGFRLAIPIPILIERPGLQRGGSNVLFWDGTVEFIPYPGKWPMTEKFIRALESLDALKEKK